MATNYADLRAWTAGSLKGPPAATGGLSAAAAALVFGCLRRHSGLVGDEVPTQRIFLAALTSLSTNRLDLLSSSPQLAQESRECEGHPFLFLYHSSLPRQPLHVMDVLCSSMSTTLGNLFRNSFFVPVTGEGSQPFI